MLPTVAAHLLYHRHPLKSHVTSFSTSYILFRLRSTILFLFSDSYHRLPSAWTTTSSSSSCPRSPLDPYPSPWSAAPPRQRKNNAHTSLYSGAGDLSIRTSVASSWKRAQPAASWPSSATWTTALSLWSCSTWKKPTSLPVVTPSLPRWFKEISENAPSPGLKTTYSTGVPGSSFRAFGRATRTWRTARQRTGSSILHSSAPHGVAGQPTFPGGIVCTESAPGKLGPINAGCWGGLSSSPCTRKENWIDG